MADSTVPPGSHEGGVLSAHIAEYTALTTRLSYWLTLQYVIYSVAGIFLAFVAEALAGKGVDHVTIAWAGCLGLQTLVWAWLQTGSEVLQTAIYLEGLRLKVSELLHSDVWGFEKYLADVRSKGYVRFEWRFGLAPLFVAGFLCVGLITYRTAQREQWRGSEVAWLAINVYLLLILVGRSLKYMQLQRELCRAAQVATPVP
jgi:hypothetical protein